MQHQPSTSQNSQNSPKQYPEHPGLSYKKGTELGKKYKDNTNGKKTNCKNNGMGKRARDNKRDGKNKRTPPPVMCHEGRDMGRGTHLGQIHPVSLVQLRSDQEIKVRDEVIFSDQGRGQTHLAVGVAHAQNFPEHSSRDDVNLDQPETDTYTDTGDVRYLLHEEGGHPGRHREAEIDLLHTGRAIRAGGGG